MENKMLSEAIEIIFKNNLTSIPLLQRKMRISYKTAEELINIMEKKGIVGAAEGSKPRKILISKNQYDHWKKYLVLGKWE